MAGDLLGLMRLLGYERFDAVGHDRGAYVVQRLALDHPDAVGRVVLLGIVPIGEALARCNARFATAWYHWYFLGQPAPMPERVIAADAEAWYHLDPNLMGAENYADALQAIADPAVQHAMCEDYRAGLGVDRDADDADREVDRKIANRDLRVRLPKAVNLVIPASAAIVGAARVRDGLSERVVKPLPGARSRRDGATEPSRQRGGGSSPAGCGSVE
jgi:pimeloyl-ACP methyl ester carboxylesterase